jgi:hypothetical protein
VPWTQNNTRRKLFGEVPLIVLGLLFISQLGYWILIQRPPFCDFIYSRLKDGGIYCALFTLAVFSLACVPKSKEWRTYILGAWVVAVPLLFQVNWFVDLDKKATEAKAMVERMDDPDKRQHVAEEAHKLEEFKYSQELNSKTWLAYVTVLAFHYFGQKGIFGAKEE